MLRGIPALKAYANLHLHELDINELKRLSKGFQEGKPCIEIISFIVVSLAVMVIHCCIWFEQKSQL